MAELLLELFSEEIPSGMQTRSSQDLQRLVCDGLKQAGIEFGTAKNFAGARRLTLVIEGLPEQSPDVSEERKGPRIGSPEKAIEGFLRGAGLASVDEAEIVTDEKKGDFYLARIEKKGRATSDVIAKLIPEIIRQFPWPKSQRWGSGRLRWVRPLHSILCVLGGAVVPFEVEGIVSGNQTRGHRFMAPDVITVADFAEYDRKLRAAYVILEAEERQKIILEGARDVANNASLELVEDDALLAETAGLVEWPVVLMGTFDEEFLDVPPEVIITAIKKHQKCFSLRQPHASRRGSAAPQHEGRKLEPHPEGEKLEPQHEGRKLEPHPEGRKLEPQHDGEKLEPHPEEGHRPVSKDGGKLANKFVLVSNLMAEDGGKAITQGNERVVRARLSDAKFFWDQDRKIKLEDRLPALESIIFHEKLGTQAERVERLEARSIDLHEECRADGMFARRSARLCKLDLVTEMVGEFPDLQGLMGKYYATDQGEDPSVAEAIEEHYRPQGPNDEVPADPISIAVALADKLDTLVGFWAIDEKPTGSKDPYALRRAALGVIRLILENNIKLTIHKYLEGGLQLYRNQRGQIFGQQFDEASLLAFFHDRLKVYLRDRGARHDLIDAVISPDADDLLKIVSRVEALGKFLETEDGTNLLAGVKRAANILRIEEKKDKPSFDGLPDANLLQQDEEKALASEVQEATKAASAAVEKEDFEGAMAVIAKLRSPVDAFFDNVTVNADEPALRENRLKLLNQIREATRAVADFSKIEG